MRVLKELGLQLRERGGQERRLEWVLSPCLDGEKIKIEFWFQEKGFEGF